jgi:vacuolar iron transporter family protein
MAMGEWVSANAAREGYQRQFHVETRNLRGVPEGEKEKLALIYEAKGSPEEQAKALTERLIANKDTALDALVREELGIDPGKLAGSPWRAGITSFFLFASGLIFPVAAFFFTSGFIPVLASLTISGVVLFLIGAGTTLFTGRGTLYFGFCQSAIGYAAAGITFFIWHLIGVAVSGW